MRLTLPSSPTPVELHAAPGRIQLHAPGVSITSRADAEMLFRAFVEALHTAGWLATDGGPGEHHAV